MVRVESPVTGVDGSCREIVAGWPDKEAWSELPAAVARMRG